MQASLLPGALNRSFLRINGEAPAKKQHLTFGKLKSLFSARGTVQRPPFIELAVSLAMSNKLTTVVSPAGLLLMQWTRLAPLSSPPREHAVAFTAAAFVIRLYDAVQKVPSTTIMMLDAAGLALFAVAGTEKALTYKANPFMAVLLGTITGVGGGTVRDIFLAQVPNVLRADVYAQHWRDRR
jgi:hypothetical protein